MNQERPKALLFVDLETSGPNPFVHVPLAVAFLPARHGATPVSFYIRSKEITWGSFAEQNFQQFAQQWHSSAMPPEQVVHAIEHYLTEVGSGHPVTLIGHNVGFDLAFLSKLAFLAGRDPFRSISHRTIDTHTILYLLYLQGRVPENALSSDGALRFFSIDVPETVRHTAVGDAIATKLLFFQLARFFFDDPGSSDDEKLLSRALGELDRILESRPRELDPIDKGVAGRWFPPTGMRRRTD